MSLRRLGPLALYAGVTVAFAVAAHLLVEALGARDGFAGLATPAHTALLLGAALTLGGALIPLGFGSGANERRRRLALFAAALPRRGTAPAFLAVSVLLQAAIAGGTLAAEGVVLEPSRLAIALVCGLLAVLFGAHLTRTAPLRVIRLFAVFLRALLAAARAASADAHAARVPVRKRSRLYALFIPNRPPPAVSAIPVFFKPSR